MIERIALTELNAELTRVIAGVHGFATRLKSTAEGVRDQHVASLRTLDGKLSAAAAQKSAAEVSAEQLQQSETIASAPKSRAKVTHKGLLQEGECIAALDSEVQAAEATCSALPAEIQNLKDTLDRDTTDLRRREAALANQESIQESKLRAMRGAVDLYRGRLGLEFRKEEKEELLLVFTHLDPSNQQREFQLGVHVVADNRYTVTRCTPELEDLGPCLEELNKGDDDFRGFVRRVRKLFQALVAQG